MSTAIARGPRSYPSWSAHARQAQWLTRAVPVETASLSERDRQRLLDRLGRQLRAYEARNRYQSELKGTTLAMVRYMRQHWCDAERAGDFDRWWRIVDRYARVLFSGELKGRGTRDRLHRLLNTNQIRPSEL